MGVQPRIAQPRCTSFQQRNQLSTNPNYPPWGRQQGRRRARAQPWSRGDPSWNPRHGAQWRCQCPWRHLQMGGGKKCRPKLQAQLKKGWRRAVRATRARHCRTASHASNITATVSALQMAPKEPQSPSLAVHICPHLIRSPVTTEPMMPDSMPPPALPWDMAGGGAGAARRRAGVRAGCCQLLAQKLPENRLCSRELECEPGTC